MQDIIRKLKKQIADGEAERWEIVHIPTEVSTVIPFRPESLDRNAFFKMIYSGNVWPGHKQVQSFLNALAKTTAATTKGPGDLRWGCSFYDRQNAKLFSVYVEQFGDTGILQNKTVKYHGALPHWFRAFSNRHFVG